MRGGRGGSGIVVIVAPTVALTPPSQVYDNTKTITVSNIPSGTSTVGKIYKGATAYTIHATEPTSNVIIKNTGSYVSVFTTSSSAYLTNTVNVNATPTTTSDDNTIEDAAPIVTTTSTVFNNCCVPPRYVCDSDDPHVTVRLLQPQLRDTLFRYGIRDVYVGYTYVGYEAHGEYV